MYVCIYIYIYIYICMYSASNFSFIGLFICLAQFIIDINFTRDRAPTPNSVILT